MLDASGAALGNTCFLHSFARLSQKQCKRFLHVVVEQNLAMHLDAAINQLSFCTRWLCELRIASVN